MKKQQLYNASMRSIHAGLSNSGQIGCSPLCINLYSSFSVSVTKYTTNMDLLFLSPSFASINGSSMFPFHNSITTSIARFSFVEWCISHSKFS